MVKRCKGLVLMCVYWIKPSSVICLYKANLTPNFTVDECFTLRHLNCNSFVISVPSLHLALFPPPCLPTRQQKDWHCKGNMLRRKKWRQLNLTIQLSPSWHSWAVDMSTSCLISLVMEILAAVCVCAQKSDFLMFCEFMCILSVY